MENAVLNALSQILSAMPNQEARLATAIRAEQKARLRDNAERDDLARERDELHAEYKDLISMGRHGRELAKQKIAQLETRLDNLESRIRAANDAVGHEIDPSAHAAEIVKEFGKIFPSLDSVPKPLLKELARLLISKLEIDLETLEFELAIALPSWGMIDAEGIKSALRLEPSPHMRTSAETQPQKGLILGRFVCSASRQPICFDCRRLRRAA